MLPTRVSDSERRSGSAALRVPPADTLDPVRRGRLFAAVAGVVVLFLAASSVPSPLYVVYQAQWGFSAATLTLIFAVYVLFLLASLLVVGGLSDHVGRRPVLAVALAVQTSAVIVFLLAQNVEMLLIARAVQGAATGAAITAMAATLVDLNPGARRSRERRDAAGRPRRRGAGLRAAGRVRAGADAPGLRPAARRVRGRRGGAGGAARDRPATLRRAGLAASAGARSLRAPRRGAEHRPGARRELGARWALPLARPVGRGEPVRAGAATSSAGSSSRCCAGSGRSARSPPSVARPSACSPPPGRCSRSAPSSPSSA